MDFAGSVMAAEDEVMTTRLTVGALFLIAARMLVVPMIANVCQGLDCHARSQSADLYLDRVGPF